MGIKKRPAVFLDRDGTLIPDMEYLAKPEHVSLYLGTVEALKLLRKSGFYLFVVTNQSGVARGYFSEETVKAVHRKLQSMLKAKGARLDAFYYCPHYPTGKIKKFAIVCDCRKPKIGMIQQALRKYPVDLKHSYVVGDKISELQLARNAGTSQGILVRTGSGRKSEKELEAKPIAKSAVVSDILKAAKYILDRKTGEKHG